MSRYLRMVMLLLAGFCFMIPLLSRPLMARAGMHGMRGVQASAHSRAHSHQAFAHDANPNSPCAE